jgi:DUF1680 family protein
MVKKILCSGRPRCRARRRTLWRQLRPAQCHGLQRNLRCHCQRVLEPPHVSPAWRFEIYGCAGKSLYNGLISGVGMDGKSFFYTNAMQVKNSFSHHAMEHERAGWFDCSCCPTNVARLIPSIPGYVYAQQEDNVYVNLFMNNTATLSVHGRPLSITQQNNYPWDGNLKFIITPKAGRCFHSAASASRVGRVAKWCLLICTSLQGSENKVEVKVNGKPQTYTFEKGYAVLQRTWKRGDVVEVALPMEVQKVVAMRR